MEVIYEYILKISGNTFEDRSSVLHVFHVIQSFETSRKC